MIILGIDPGFDRMGCAVLEKSASSTDKLIYSTCLVSNRKLSQEERLFSLGKKLEEIIKKYKPDIVAVEKLFFTKNQKTALQVAEARGMVLYLASSKKIPVHSLTPLQIKIALTGYGRAEKIQVQKMVMAILGLKKKPKYDDEIDAIAAAITCSASYPQL
ncbi:crossover junction endodeoxyribonuclease RuvC [Patescibacteria group bacterium]|nr:crossover junction endodeoxyribonuclease RuvC [Patescibacteria group bacterium]MBU2219371.1 crossover junction endodeoxyribonuclease RuvC [Patescibacteria group bacterium]MBU2263391.1 crossover junction endodeoxyribonuclease RuvC [Patescibacteria group bacterium]